jgi:hypothetical protein
MLISQKKRETELNAIEQLLMEQKTEHVIELLRRKSKNKKNRALRVSSRISPLDFCRIPTLGDGC